MDVKICKLSEDAVIPTYAHPGDAGMDVVATSVNITDDYIEYGTGLSFEVPEGYCMLIFPRSSNSKKDLILANSVGILDSTYRGELKLRFKKCYQPVIYGLVARTVYNVGDKVGQIMILPYPQINFTEVDSLSETERGDGGFGSTGN